jgi:putative membrane protein
MIKSGIGARREALMIERYGDHAANERTFLAWVRTGIAVIAFGFVIERFNLFLLTIANAALGDQATRLHLTGLSGGVGRYEGLAFIFGGVGLIVLAVSRFTRVSRLLDDDQVHSARAIRTELILAGALVLLVTVYSVYLALVGRSVG